LARGFSREGPWPAGRRASLKLTSGYAGNVSIEDAPQMALALDWTSKGMDFADALHLAGADHCTAFVTFDRKLAKSAKALAPIPVVAS